MNLKGGYILLNLCAISLALSGEPVTITNADVLKKLSEFQMYVGTDEFKSQPKVGLKPVLVQYRSNESKINGVILCKSGFDTTNKKLIISGTDGEKLSIQIECVFIDNPEDVKVTPYVLQSATVTAYRGVIGDLDILGDTVVKTITQTHPNWELDIKSILNTNFFKDTSKLYAKLVLLGNELSLVISGEFVAKENAQTYASIFSSSSINIPNEIASKIYRGDGTTLIENPVGTSDFSSVVTEFMYVRQNPSISQGQCILRSGGAKTLSLTAYSFGTTSEDSECFIDLRVQLLII